MAESTEHGNPGSRVDEGQVAVVIDQELATEPGLEELVVEGHLDYVSQNQDEIGMCTELGDPSRQKKGDVSCNEDCLQSTEEVLITPVVGMVYNSWEAVEGMYKTYGKKNGFGVIRAQSAYSYDKKQKRAMTWRCECCGDPDMELKKANRKNTNPMELGGSNSVAVGKKRRRKSKKCFCQAMVYASVNTEGLWEIRKVKLEHSGHNPTPRKAKLVKEYRMQYFNNNVKTRVLNGVEVRLPLSKIHCTLARERDGLDNMPFTEKDMRHVVDEKRRLKMEGGDAKALFMYLDKMQRDNSSFFHSHRVDDTGRMKDVFWADARSRVAYTEFGDVVCFDSTYLTNRYHLPFANFVGVNHHGQSILLGCALLSHEDVDTFNWVFKQWLVCMDGKAPEGILTDQAHAMREPLQQLMPHTRHRWCIWHILRKLPHKLGNHERYVDLKEELLEVIYDTFSVTEFESSWSEAIQKYGLCNHKWLLNLYNERSMWVPVYMKEIFWAGMRTTQRVESINSFFDQFVTRTTRLCEFGEKYIAAIEKRVSQEKDEDERGVKYTRNLVTGIALEKFFQKVYTDSKFHAIQKECERLVYCYVREVSCKDQNNYEYLIEDRIWKTCKGGRGEYLSPKRRMYSVMYNAESKDVNCSCKYFETHGLLCRHSIRVLDMNLVEEPPQKYVLRRWRKDVIRKHSLVKVCYHDPSKTEYIKRFDRLNVEFESLAYDAARSERAVECVLNGIKAMKQHVAGLVDVPSPEKNSCTPPQSNTILESPSEFSCNATLADNGTPMSYPSQHSSSSQAIDTDTSPTVGIHDPPMPEKKRGRPKSNRYRSPIERGWKKANTSRSKLIDMSNHEGKMQKIEICKNKRSLSDNNNIEHQDDNQDRRDDMDDHLELHCEQDALLSRNNICWD